MFGPMRHQPSTKSVKGLYSRVSDECDKSQKETLKWQYLREFGGILISQHHLIVFGFLAIHLRDKTCMRLPANTNNDIVLHFGDKPVPSYRNLCTYEYFLPLWHMDGTSVSAPAICKPRPQVMRLVTEELKCDVKISASSPQYRTTGFLIPCHALPKSAEVMHSSFITTPTRPGYNKNIDFSLYKALVYARHRPTSRVE